MNAFLFFIVFVAGFLAPSSAFASDAVCDDPRVLHIALIPKENVQKQLQEFRPLQIELEKALQRRVAVVPSPSYAAVMEGLLNESIDLAELGPASYAMLLDRNAAVKPFAAQSGRGTAGAKTLATYQSVLIAQRNRGFDGVNDLRNKSLSLTDPASTSGNLVPRRFIKQKTGQSIENYFGRVTYAGSHDRALEAVRKGMVDAGFVSRTRYDEALKTGLVAADELVVLWQSESLPLNPFVMRNRLCSAVAVKIQKVFFNAEPLRPLLDARGAEQFVPVTSADYEVIRKMFSER
jgi:phosphonate transport system substrate-binding protein